MLPLSTIPSAPRRCHLKIRYYNYRPPNASFEYAIDVRTKLVFNKDEDEDDSDDNGSGDSMKGFKCMGIYWENGEEKYDMGLLWEFFLLIGM